MGASSVTAVVLTFDEAENIGRCLDSLDGVCPVFVVDSGSRDDTVELSRERGATVVHHPFTNHSSQWQWALTNLPIRSEWILALDADQAVSPALKSRLARDLSAVSDEVAGIFVRHLYVFGGSTIRRGGIKGYRCLLLRRGRVSADQSDLVDHRFAPQGRTETWSEPVVEHNVHDDDVSLWMAKQDRYSLRLAVEEELRRRRLLDWERAPALLGDRDSRFMWLRDRWIRLPLFARPVGYFLYRYFLRGGFLDGRGGFLYHALQGFWLRLIVDCKTLHLRSLRLDDASLLRFRDAALSTSTGSVTEVARSMNGAGGHGDIP